MAVGRLAVFGVQEAPAQPPPRQRRGRSTCRRAASPARAHSREHQHAAQRADRIDERALPFQKGPGVAHGKRSWSWTSPALTSHGRLALARADAIAGEAILQSVNNPPSSQRATRMEPIELGSAMIKLEVFGESAMMAAVARMLDESTTSAASRSPARRSRSTRSSWQLCTLGAVDELLGDLRRLGVPEAQSTLMRVEVLGRSSGGWTRRACLGRRARFGRAQLPADRALPRVHVRRRRDRVLRRGPVQRAPHRRRDGDQSRPAPDHRSGRRPGRSSPSPRRPSPRNTEDMAAVLDWRLPEPTPTDPGPLPGFPAFRRRFMIIPFGASIWRSDRSSLSASQIRFETAPARTANSRYGRRRAATRRRPHR